MALTGGATAVAAASEPRAHLTTRHHAAVAIGRYPNNKSVLAPEVLGFEGKWVSDTCPSHCTTFGLFSSLHYEDLLELEAAYAVPRNAH